MTLFFVAIIFGGCLERFVPNIEDSQQNFLVVDGLITDQSGPYYVTLSLSSSLEEDNTALSGVEVSIEEKNGEIELLMEGNPGIYETTSIQGKVGNEYRLNLVYNGKKYQSTWEKILPSPGIDSVYFIEKIVGTRDKAKDIAGAQFYVDSHGGADDPRYFRYEWEETWKIGVRWPPNFIYLGNDMYEANPVLNLVCWKYNYPAGINVGTTVGLTENVLSHHPVAFIKPDDERFIKRYSLLLKQYSLDEKEYLFWKALQESNEEVGSLFDKQPATVTGNISGSDGSSDKVLGYFSASGLRDHRVYVTPKQVSGSLFLPSPCLNLDSLHKSDLEADYEQTVLDAIDNGKIFNDFIYSDLTGAILGSLITVPTCSDCTAKGGSLDKPDFWDE